MKEFVCVKCRDRAKGCTMIAENGDRLPMICVVEDTRKVITCLWREIPERTIPLTSIFPFE